MKILIHKPNLYVYCIITTAILWGINDDQHNCFFFFYIDTMIKNVLKTGVKYKLYDETSELYLILPATLNILFVKNKLI